MNASPRDKADADGSPAADDRTTTQEEQMPPTPDSDGPHDVSDDKVIEKTLPSQR